MLAVAFAIGSAWSILYTIVAPQIIGSHAAIYTEAAKAWLTGGNPWQVGPSLVVFAGPPTMLLPFVPFTVLPVDGIRFGWVALDIAIAVLALRRLGLPAYWLLFPPLVSAIVLGHPEVLVLGLIVLARGPLSGLAAIVKPYAGSILLAERRFSAIALAAAITVLSLAVLPWGLFLEQAAVVSGNLARQDSGDSTFGQPLLMAIAAVALLSLGLRRALWFVVPVLWPYAQPIYKVGSMPLLPPILALAWAIPVAGMTLIGLVVLAVLVQAERWRRLPSWLASGIRPASPMFASTEDRAPSRSAPAGAAAGSPVGAR